eukprot:3541839-Pleurochrysis_carterae.AAC.10
MEAPLAPRCFAHNETELRLPRRLRLPLASGLFGGGSSPACTNLRNVCPRSLLSRTISRSNRCTTCECEMSRC